MNALGDCERLTVMLFASICMFGRPDRLRSILAHWAFAQPKWTPDCFDHFKDSTWNLNPFLLIGAPSLKWRCNMGTVTFTVSNLKKERNENVEERRERQMVREQKVLLFQDHCWRWSEDLQRVCWQHLQHNHCDCIASHVARQCTLTAIICLFFQQCHEVIGLSGQLAPALLNPGHLQRKQEQRMRRGIYCCSAGRLWIEDCESCPPHACHLTLTPAGLWVSFSLVSVAVCSVLVERLVGLLWGLTGTGREIAVIITQACVFQLKSQSPDHVHLQSSCVIHVYWSRCRHTPLWLSLCSALLLVNIQL